MKLLKNRPLAALCIIFITASLISHNTEPKIKMFLVLSLFLCLLAALFIRRSTPKRLFGALCLSFALLAVISQFIGIDLRRRSAESYVGDCKALMLVTDADTSLKASNEYSVDIREIDGERVYLSATLVTDSAVTLEVGDLIYTEAHISPAAERNRFIGADIYEDDTCVLISKNNSSLNIFLSNLRSSLSDYMDSVLGDGLSPIARGFLLGDKSGMPSDTIKDFRRAGVSHLLAVSGFHVSVLIAFAELILRALSIPKKPRSVLLSIIALLFLAMTGFALSACRAVIMLLCVYFCFLFLQEHDSITALFLSVSTIIFLSPSAVTDVGLWLSFLATLGIIAVYSPISSRLIKKEPKSAKGYLRSFFKKLFLAILLTFICNIFICMLVWLVFGEISLVSILSNPLLAPISTLFVTLIPITLFVAKLPFGNLLVSLLSLVSKLLLAICEFFSDMSGAVLSLRYPFAPFIIVPMTLALAVMLLIELRKKWTILLPPLISCALFATCLLGYNLLHANKLDVSFYAENDNEMIVITKGSSASVCDLSSAPSSLLYSIENICSENMATHISEYTVTHYHKKHPVLLEKLFKSELVEKLYLPYPSSEDEREIAADILIFAADAKVKVYLYADAEKLPTLDGSYISVIRSDKDEASEALCVVLGYRDSLLTYLNSDLIKTELIRKITLNSDFLIFGRHENNFLGETAIKADHHKLKGALFADREIYIRSEFELGDASVYLSPRDEKKLLFELVLD